MILNRVVEYVFFFGLLAVVGYLLWLMFAPFISALALSAVIVTICYPLYERILSHIPKQNQTIAALLTTFLVFVVVILPVFWVISMLVGEAVSVYRIIGNGQFPFEATLRSVESAMAAIIPGLDLNVTEYLRQAAEWLTTNLGAIFAGTASTIFQFFIAMIGSFYFFRDGKHFTRQLVIISPLPNDQDELILRRLATAVRSVATGTVLVALLQGVLTAIGLTVVGFDRSILLGTVASFGALIPGVGTSIVFIPSIAFLFITGAYVQGIILLVWGALAVGLIDNFLGPYLMSRGNAMHPFIILLSVLGGVALFGPIGFVIGPVITSLFIVLLELYSQHIALPD